MVLPVHSRLGLRGHFIGADKADEMIQPIDIEPSKSRSQAFDPPSVVLLVKRLPAIHGDIPHLPCGGEIIGGNSGDHRRISIGIQFEEPGMSPDIGALVRYEQGNIADQPDPFRLAVSS